MPTPTPTPAPTPEEIAFAHLSEIVEWLENPAEVSDSSDSDLLINLWLLDSQLINKVVELPWVADGLNEIEASDLVWLKDKLAAGERPKDTNATKIVLNYSWVIDGITDMERRAWLGLVAITVSAPELALRLTKLPWITDGLFQYESDAILEFRRIFQADKGLAGQILDYPLFSRDISYDDTQVLYGLARIARSDPELASRASAFFGVPNAQVTTSHLWEPLDHLNIIAKWNRGFAGKLVDLLSHETRIRDLNLLGNLRRLIQEYPRELQQLQKSPWFSHGLNDEEAAFIITMSDILLHSPADFLEMVQTRYVQSRTIHLPLSGEVNIWAIQKTPFPEGENIVEDVEDALRSLETLTRTPLPNKHVIVLIVVVDQDSNYELPYSNLDLPWPGAAHAGGHVRVARYGNEKTSLSVLFHEVAHYYFNFFPAWLLEGGAEFAARYIWHHNDHGSVAEWRSSVDTTVGPACGDWAANIYELRNTGFGYQAHPYKHCLYSMGSHFFASLFHSFGGDVTSAALQDIFRIIWSENSRPITSKDVFLAFQNNLHPGQESEFQDLFNRLHGGPQAEMELNITDDHSDSPSSATPVQPFEIVHGALEHPLDTDYFRIAAEAGEKFKITFNQDIFGEYLGADLHVEVHPPDGGQPIPISSLGGGRQGMEVEWEPSSTGEYHFSLESTSGITGVYNFQFIPISASGSDDHGDHPRNATDIVAGKKVGATLDYQGDVDYFRLQVEAGKGYLVEVENQTLDYSRVSLFEFDGTGLRAESGSARYGLRGAYAQWIPAKSGDNFIAVESEAGNTGSYILIITAFGGDVDDHGDDPSTATPISVGQLVEATLNDVSDKDYFRFRADADRSYNIRLNHTTTYHQPVTIFTSDGVTPIHEFSPSGLQATSSFIPWVAPESDDYFILFHSPDGDTGDYNLVLLSGGSGDDHSDDSTSATKLTLGQSVHGALDHEDDFDYFLFQTEAGRRYEVAIDYDGFSFTAPEPDPRVSLFGPNDVNLETPFVASSRRQSGKYILWETQSSGHYYVVVWSPQGDVGPYSVTVTNPRSQ